jgi:hypothetical protein
MSRNSVHDTVAEGMTPNDHSDDVPDASASDSSQHDPVAIARRVLGPIALDLFGARKLHQYARELRRAQDQQEARVLDAEFEEFWAIYPRPENKLQAAKMFRKAKRRAGAAWPAVRQQIMAKAPRADATASEDHYVPLPWKWLHDERWTDEDE